MVHGGVKVSTDDVDHGKHFGDGIKEYLRRDRGINSGLQIFSQLVLNAWDLVFR